MAETKYSDALIGFHRLRGFPLDSSSVFPTLSNLEEYISKGTSAYEGQVVSVLAVDENSRTAVPYIISKDRTDGLLKPVQLLNSDFDTKYVETSEFEKTSYSIKPLYNSGFASMTFTPKSGDPIVYKLSVDTDDFVINGAGVLSLKSDYKALLEGLGDYELTTTASINKEIADRLDLSEEVMRVRLDMETGIALEKNRATDAEDDLRSQLVRVFHFKGSVQSYDMLSTSASENTIGDVYQVQEAYTSPDGELEISANESVVWNGESWEDLGGIVDLSAYITADTTRSEIAASLSQAKSYSDANKTSALSEVSDAYIKKTGDLTMEGSFLPKADLAAALGSSSKRFSDVFSKSFTADSLQSGNATISELDVAETASIAVLKVHGTNVYDIFSKLGHTHTVSEITDAKEAARRAVDSALSDSASPNLPTSAAVLSKLTEYSKTSVTDKAYAPIRASTIGNNYVVADAAQTVTGAKNFTGGLSLGVAASAETPPTEASRRVVMEYDDDRRCVRFSFVGA